MNIDLSKYDQSWYSRGRSGSVVLLWWLVQGTLFKFSLHNMYSFRNRRLLRLFGAKLGMAKDKIIGPIHLSMEGKHWGSLMDRRRCGVLQPG